MMETSVAELTTQVGLQKIEDLLGLTLGTA